MENDIGKRVTASLQAAGLRATKTRMAIVRALSNTPLSLAELKCVVQKSAHQATVYRAVSELVKAGIVHRLESPTGTRYEYATTHHHHITCSSCGRIEDIHLCIPNSVKQSALRSARSFSNIQAHSLEFVGVCSPCAARQ